MVFLSCLKREAISNAYNGQIRKNCYFASKSKRNTYGNLLLNFETSSYQSGTIQGNNLE